MKNLYLVAFAVLFLAVIVAGCLSNTTSQPLSAITGQSCTLAVPYFGSINCVATNAINDGASNADQSSYQIGLFLSNADYDMNSIFSHFTPIHHKNVYQNSYTFQINNPTQVLSGNTCYGRISISSDNNGQNVLRTINYAYGFTPQGTYGSWQQISGSDVTAQQNNYINLYPIVCIENAGFGSSYKYQAHPSIASWRTTGEQWTANFDSARDIPLDGTLGCVSNNAANQIIQNAQQSGDNAGVPSSGQITTIQQAVNTIANVFGLKGNGASLAASKFADLNSLPVGKPGDAFAFVEKWVSDPAYSLNLKTYNGQQVYMTPAPVNGVGVDVYSLADIQTTNGCFTIPQTKIATVQCSNIAFCSTQYGAGYYCDTTFKCSKSPGYCQSDLDCGASSACSNKILQSNKCDLSTHTCQNPQQSVACCPSDNNACPSGQYCSAQLGYTCQNVQGGIVDCPSNFMCCQNYQGYRDKACADSSKTCINGACVSPSGCPTGQYTDTRTGFCVYEPQCTAGQTLDSTSMPHTCKNNVQDNTLLIAIVLVLFFLVVIALILTSGGKKRQ